MKKFMLLTACYFGVLANIEGMEEVLQPPTKHVKEKAPKKDASMLFKFNPENLKNVYLNINGREIDLKKTQKDKAVVKCLKELIDVLGVDMQKQGNPLRKSEFPIASERGHQEPNVRKFVEQEGQEGRLVDSMEFETEVKKDEGDYDNIYWRLPRFADKISSCNVSENYNDLSKEFEEIIKNIDLNNSKITSMLYKEVPFKFVIAMLLINASKSNMQILKEVLGKIDTKLCEHESDDVAYYQQIGNEIINDIPNYDNAAMYTGEFYENISDGNM